MAVKVKICGITTMEAAQAAAAAGADLLGFVFAPSKRRIQPEQAKQIIRYLPQPVITTGVFVDESPSEVEAIAKYCGLDMVQLHGSESPEECRTYKLPVIKAFSVQTGADLQQLGAYHTTYYLLDSKGNDQQRGGTGQCFDWQILEALPSQVKQRLILAGGLNPDNVQAAVQRVKPLMVDVSSGVETNGHKDIGKIINFVAQAKGR